MFIYPNEFLNSMTTKITSILFLSAILFTSAIAASIPMMQEADAYSGSGNYVRQTNSKGVCGDKLCSEYEGGRAEYEAKKSTATKAISEKLAEIEKEGTTSEKKISTDSEVLKSQLENILKKIEMGMRLSASEITIAKKAIQEGVSTDTAKSTYNVESGEAKGTPSFGQHAFGLAKSETITSVQDPGQGHEGHQIAIILPPTDKVYVGKLTYSASEEVQYVTIHGPLAEGEDGGQAIWSPDGETKYALTFIDNQGKSGGWAFAGNALALHTKNKTPFTATYSVAYAEIDPGVYPKGTVATGTVSSIQDPGIGHEQHSIALILPPRDIPYQGGVVSYSASDNVQLVALIGPLEDDEIHGQAIWTPDGETKYAMTLVEGGKMGVWNTFSGNALALHSFTEKGFTATYTLAGLH
jgi:hypothetical protein